MIHGEKLSSQWASLFSLPMSPLHVPPSSLLLFLVSFSFVTSQCDSKLVLPGNVTHMARFRRTDQAQNLCKDATREFSPLSCSSLSKIPSKEILSLDSSEHIRNFEREDSNVIDPLVRAASVPRYLLLLLVTLWPIEITYKRCLIPLFTACIVQPKKRINSV